MQTNDSTKPELDASETTNADAIQGGAGFVETQQQHHWPGRQNDSTTAHLKAVDFKYCQQSTPVAMRWPGNKPCISVATHSQTLLVKTEVRRPMYPV